MQKDYLEFYAMIHELHRRIVENQLKMSHDIMTNGDVEDLADLCFVLRESFNHIDACRVELRKLQDTAAKLFTIIWAADPNSTGDKVKTEWCTVSSDIKTRVSIPHPDKDPIQYKAVMNALGVSQELIDMQVLRTDWDSFGDWLTQRQHEGHAIPDGIEKTYTEYKVRVTSRKKLPIGKSDGSGVVKPCGDLNHDGTEANVDCPF